MNKEQALQRLSAIEKEAAELKKLIEAKDVPDVFQGRLLKATDTTCFRVSDYGNIEITLSDDDSVKLGTAFATREAAEQYAKHLRLMQEVRIAMAQDWGDVKCDWSATPVKWVIRKFMDSIQPDTISWGYFPVAFRTEKACRDFFNKYTQEELKLMIMGVE